MMGLGLIDIFPWRMQKDIIDRVQELQRSLVKELESLVNKIRATGIRGSWTGWVRIQEKVKRESLDAWRTWRRSGFSDWKNKGRPY